MEFSTFFVLSKEDHRMATLAPVPPQSGGSGSSGNAVPTGEEEDKLPTSAAPTHQSGRSVGPCLRLALLSVMCSHGWAGGRKSFQTKGHLASEPTFHLSVPLAPP